MKSETRFNSSSNKLKVTKIQQIHVVLKGIYWLKVIKNLTESIIFLNDHWIVKQYFHLRKSIGLKEGSGPQLIHVKV